MRFSLLVVIILGFLGGLKAQAASLSYTGCWEKSQSGTAVTLNLKSFDCQITAVGDSPETLTFTLEYVDPDFFLVDNYDSLSRSGTDLIFSKSLTAGATEVINVSPWYEPEEIYFAAMSDPQPDTEEWYDPVHQEILQQVNIINPYFTLLAGDLIHGSTSESTSRDSFEGFQYIMEEELDTPWFVVPGNHDILAGIDLYQEYFGESYYSFDFSTAHFIALSTEESGETNSISGDQYDWLASDLGANEASEVVAFWHRPLVPPAWSSYSGWLDSDQANLVAGLLDQGGTDFVINGHTHGYDYQFINTNDFSAIVNGFYQLVTGGAGADPTTGYNHYILTAINQGEISHSLINYNEFPLTTSTSQLNDGSEEEVSLAITNSASSEWPWLRLKIKLDPTIEYYQAKDESGNLYSVESQAFDDYRVVYLAAPIPAASTRTITVSQQIKAHQGVINTFNTQGEVAYSSQPSSLATEVELMAQTSSTESQIEIEDWEVAEDYHKQWQETAGSATSQTNYTIGDLQADYCYLIEVNQAIFGRYCADSSGQIQFTYNQAKLNRSFSVTQDNDWRPDDIALIPASAGSGQVRIFDSQGEVVDQFQAYSEDWQGEFGLAWGDVDGDREGELVTMAPSGYPTLLKVFSTNGHLLAKKRILSERYEGGLNIAVGDVDNNGSEEIIVAPTTGNYNKIKVYRYQPKKGSLRLVTQVRVYDQNFTGGIKVLTGQVNDNLKKEILVLPQSGQEQLKIYKFTKSQLIKLAEQNVYSKSEYSGLSVGVSNLNKKGRSEIIVGPGESGTSRIKVYRLDKDNNLNLALAKTVYKYYKGGIDIIGAEINGQAREELAIVPKSGEGTVKVFRQTDGRLDLLQKLAPYGNYYTDGLNVQPVDSDGDCDLELIVAPAAGEPNIRLYNYETELALEDWWWGYDLEFTGGVNPAQY